MLPAINTHQMDLDSRDFMLIDISRSTGTIGTAVITGPVFSPYEKPYKTQLLYAGDEVLLNFTRPPRGNNYSDKVVSQVTTFTVCDDKIKTILSTVSDNYFTYSQSMSKSMQPVFELLAEGTYVCHEAKMIPSDGQGKFFWNAYTTRHIVPGSAKFNRHLGKNSNYIPCFLVPTLSPAEYSDAKCKTQREKISSGKKVGGLAYHMSGMFSALLDGHHTATACLACNVDFRCILIEPVNEVLYESREEAIKYGREPKIIALSCPYVKIPVGEVPPAMLESFLLRRAGVKPKQFPQLMKKAAKTLKAVNKRTIPREITNKAELLPDSSMVESASTISGLSNEQLDALVAGEVNYDDKVIISSNYHNSVVTACNFLHYEDFERFFNFSEAIIKNPELVSVHKYVIDRLCVINDSRIYDLFTSLLNTEDDAYKLYTDIFNTYIVNYNKYLSDNLADKQQRAKKISKAAEMLGSEVSESSLAQMEAIGRMSRRG